MSVQLDTNIVIIYSKDGELAKRVEEEHRTLTSPFTARNMGKNDIWIAATASALNVPLITTDKDFQHLDGVFIELIWIDIQKYR